MAAIKTTRWSRLVLKVSNGADPEEFAPMCSINAARGLTFTANMSEDSIPDCDDLEKIQWLIREKVSLSVDATGSGKSNKKDVPVLFEWWKSPDPKRCQMVLDDPDPTLVITFEGDYHLSNMTLAGDPGTPTASGDIALSSTGEVTATYGTAVAPGSA